MKEDRKKHDKKPLKEKEPVEKTSETRISTTNPESGFMVRDGKPRGFYYLDHVTVDGKLNLITDVHVTPGNVHDSVPYIDRLDRQIKRFGFEVEAVALDAGYLTAPICHELHERDIFSVIAHRRYRPKKSSSTSGNTNTILSSAVISAPRVKNLTTAPPTAKGIENMYLSQRYAQTVPTYPDVPTLRITPR